MSYMNSVGVSVPVYWMLENKAARIGMNGNTTACDTGYDLKF
jgi:hypothetical protein